jgi:hypothetical protein
MNMNKFLILMIVAATIGITTTNEAAVFAQQPAPPLEKPATTTVEESSPSQSLGKITIQISQTEQIIIDLPLKSENKYQVIPIK